MRQPMCPPAVTSIPPAVVAAEVRRRLGKQRQPAVRQLVELIGCGELPQFGVTPMRRQSPVAQFAHEHRGRKVRPQSALNEEIS